jgi:hypothetical protein
LKEEIKGWMTCDGVMIPTKMSSNTMSAIAAPILKALLITIPTRKPITSGTRSATTKVAEATGGRISAIEDEWPIPRYKCFDAMLYRTSAYWERVTLRPVASSTSWVGNRLLMKLTTFSS